MAVQPNLGGLTRVGYVLVGVVLVAWGFFGSLPSWVHVILPILGGITIIEGLIGF